MEAHPLAALERLIPAHAGSTLACTRSRCSRRAHPRSRGVDSASLPIMAARSGSSPLTRGRHHDGRPGRGGLGLIPAHAGSTSQHSPATASQAAHPRSRGVDCPRVRSRRVRRGSSPLTRGRRRCSCHSQRLHRLIPAHAGSTCWRCGGRRAGTAHPRSRGVDDATAGAAVLAGRLIPAHAGSTHPPPAPGQEAGAHPRSRGVDRRPTMRKRRPMGSSPLTRGRQVLASAADDSAGLIPAHAGSTSATRSPTTPTPAHPRSRGVDHRLSMQYDPKCGLIPAHAGSTGAGVLPGDRPRAHPRSRGVDAARPSARARKSGSSPLTRGRRRDHVWLCRDVRLIPAHAGSTRGGRTGGGPPGAHPRSRGVDSPASSHSPVWGGGSSPLTRGRPRGGRWGRWSWGGAHPRSRGVDRPWHRPMRRPAGSSPLTRGRQALAQADEETGRLIPAHAGSTTVSLASETLFEGSSPLTRGRRVWHRARPVRRRLIPAHAGSTVIAIAVLLIAPAHPRSRGVDGHDAPGAPWDWGSSPLTRGRRLQRLGLHRGGRLIPAHAGSTCPPSGRASRQGAHPRSRGVDMNTTTFRPLRTGSSPLTRGRHMRLITLPGSLRLIPAHAGST